MTAFATSQGAARCGTVHDGTANELRVIRVATELTLGTGYETGTFFSNSTTSPGSQKL